MITKRYFYTDALAAAWMMKHFGMRFANHNNGTEILMENLLRHALTGNVCGIHVHADSLPLLEPQDGDFVEFERWYWARKRDEAYVKDAPPHMICGWMRKNGSPNKLGGEWLGINNVGTGFDDNYVGSFEMPFKIIQRNGLPFHYPESVEA